MRVEAVNFQIIHKKKLFVNETTDF